MIGRKRIAYFDLLHQAILATEASMSGTNSKVLDPIDDAVEAIEKRRVEGKHVYFVGNGGSLAAGSHFANDLCLAGVQATALASVVDLSCVGNDFGFDNSFSKQLEWHIKSDDLLIAMSCSGESKNILKAVAAATNGGASIITFTGFKPDNPLRKLGDLNFHVPSKSYGIVQLAHEAILHCIVDSVAGLI